MLSTPNPFQVSGKYGAGMTVVTAPRVLERRIRATYPSVIPADRAETTVSTAALQGSAATDAANPLVECERLRADCYAVSVDGMVIGYVDVIGRVHVALRGARYDRAVEVAQQLDLRSAVLILTLAEDR